MSPLAVCHFCLPHSWPTCAWIALENHRIWVYFMTSPWMPNGSIRQWDKQPECPYTTRHPAIGQGSYILLSSFEQVFFFLSHNTPKIWRGKQASVLRHCTQLSTAAWISDKAELKPPPDFCYRGSRDQSPPGANINGHPSQRDKRVPVQSCSAWHLSSQELAVKTGLSTFWIEGAPLPESWTTIKFRNVDKFKTKLFHNFINSENCDYLHVHSRL